MRNVKKLVEAHLNTWAVPDSDKRATAIERVYSLDVTVVEPDGVVRGRPALNERITQLHVHFGGLEFILDGPIHHHHDYAMYKWRQPTAIRSEDVAGWDVLHFEGQLIDRAVMFIPGYENLNVPGHRDQAG